MVDNRTTHYGGRNPPPLIGLLKMCFLMLVTENLDMWWDPTYILIIQAQLAAIGSLEEIGRVDKEKRINWMIDFYALVLPLVIHDTYIWKWDFIEFNLRFPGVVAFITAALDITLEEWEESGPGDGWKRIVPQRVFQKYFHNIPIVNGLLNIGTGRGETMQAIYAAVNGRLNEALLYLDHALLPDRTSLEANRGFVQIRRFVPARGFTQYENMRFVLETANDPESRRSAWRSAETRLQVLRLGNGPGGVPRSPDPPPRPRRQRDRSSSSSSSNNNTDDNEVAGIDNGNGYNNEDEEEEDEEEVEYNMAMADFFGMNDHNGGGGDYLELDEQQPPSQQRQQRQREQQQDQLRQQQQPQQQQQQQQQERQQRQRRRQQRQEQQQQQQPPLPADDDDDDDDGNNDGFAEFDDNEPELVEEGPRVLRLANFPWNGPGSLETVLRILDYIVYNHRTQDGGVILDQVVPGDVALDNDDDMDDEQLLAAQRINRATECRNRRKPSSVELVAKPYGTQKAFQKKNIVLAVIFFALGVVYYGPSNHTSLRYVVDLPNIDVMVADPNVFVGPSDFATAMMMDTVEIPDPATGGLPNILADIPEKTTGTSSGVTPPQPQPGQSRFVFPPQPGQQCFPGEDVSPISASPPVQGCGGDSSYGDKKTVGRPQQGGFFGAISWFLGQQEPGQGQEGADRPNLGPNPNFNEQHQGQAGGQLQPPTAAADDDTVTKIGNGNDKDGENFKSNPINSCRQQQVLSAGVPLAPRLQQQRQQQEQEQNDATSTATPSSTSLSSAHVTNLSSSSFISFVPSVDVAVNPLLPVRCYSVAQCSKIARAAFAGISSSIPVEEEQEPSVVKHCRTTQWFGRFSTTSCDPVPSSIEEEEDMVPMPAPVDVVVDPLLPVRCYSVPHCSQIAHATFAGIFSSIPVEEEQEPSVVKHCRTTQWFGGFSTTSCDPVPSSSSSSIPLRNTKRTGYGVSLISALQYYKGFLFVVLVGLVVVIAITFFFIRRPCQLVLG